MTTYVARLGATQPSTASTSARTIAGLAVPYGVPGVTEFGPLTFARGSLTFGAPDRVKLLRQHNQDQPLGKASVIEESDEGLRVKFEIPEGPDGDRALTEAANGLRDGFSVGVLLDAGVVDQLLDATGDPVAASGRLLEVSQVTLPAFDDARIAAGAPRLLACSLQLVPDPTPPVESTVMETATPALAAAPAPVEVTPTPTPNPFDTIAHQVAAEAPVYTFDGRGPSFVRDMWRARYEGDPDAQERVARFNARWTRQDPAQVGAFLAAAVETRPNVFIPAPYNPDQLVQAINKGRPLVSRIGTVNLTDATPFRLPVEGDMVAGVGTHTEGTSHVAEGDSQVSDVTITPGAISGAFRLSRELIDASNPAIDQIALRQMTRLYAYDTEAKVVAALNTADSTATASINTTIEVRQQINAYYDALFYDPTGIACNPAFLSTLMSEVDTTGRTMLPSINPMNSVGTSLAGATGATVDGVELFKAWGVAATMAYLFSAPDVFIGESSLQTFRFEEIEGPGIVKLALWAYFAAAVTRAGSVVKVTSV